jgi:hypothetical protein
MLPHAFGLDIEVPFINWREAKLHVGIGPMAPPAETNTKHITTNLESPRHSSNTSAIHVPLAGKHR